MSVDLGLIFSIVWYQGIFFLKLFQRYLHHRTWYQVSGTNIKVQKHWKEVELRWSNCRYHTVERSIRGILLACKLKNEQLVCWASSVFAEDNLRVRANRFEWHPATVLFVYIILRSLPELPACLYLGLHGDSLAATAAELLLRATQTLEILTPGKKKGHSRGKWLLYALFLDIDLLISLSPPAVYDRQQVVIATGKSCSPLAFRQWKQPVSGYCFDS